MLETKSSATFYLFDNTHLAPISPLSAFEPSPLLFDEENYRIENCCNCNCKSLSFSDSDSNTHKMMFSDDIASKRCLSTNDASTTRNVPFFTSGNFGKCLPSFFPNKLLSPEEYVNEQIITFEGNSYECKYNSKSHQKQIGLIGKIPVPPSDESAMILLLKDVLNKFPCDETTLREEMEHIIEMSDQHMLVPYRTDLARVYNKLVENIDVDNEVIEKLSKVIMFTAGFTSGNFSTYDCSVMVNLAILSYYNLYKDFLTSLVQVLQCDFIDANLLEALIKFFKNFNDRRISGIRWCLLNINPSQVIDSHTFVPPMRLSLSRPVNVTETFDLEMLKSPSDLVKNISINVMKCKEVILENKNPKVVQQWGKFFATISQSFSTLDDGYTNEKLINNSGLFAKTLSTLTKFSSICCDISHELPNIVCQILDSVSSLDAYVAHTKTKCILRSELVSIINSELARLRDYSFSSRDPSVCSHYTILFWNMVKIQSLIENSSVPISLLRRLPNILDELSLLAPTANASGIIQRTAFQLSALNENIAPMDEKFLGAENAVINLTRTLLRCYKKEKDPIIKYFSKQWATYMSFVVSSLREVQQKPSDVRKVVSEMVKTLGPLFSKKKVIGIEDECNRLQNCFNLLLSQ